MNFGYFSMYEHFKCQYQLSVVVDCFFFFNKVSYSINNCQFDQRVFNQKLCTAAKMSSLRLDALKTLFPITKACPCNGYPLIPHFYIVIWGILGNNLFFYFFYPKIDCGY